MNINLIKSREALQPTHLAQSIDKSSLVRYAQEIKQLLDDIDTSKPEDYIKTSVIRFLEKTWYENKFHINIQDRKDLVIRNGSNKTDAVSVIIEFKSLVNAEMVSKGKFNSKALHELVRYYMHERLDNNNLFLKNLVITNGIDWYIIKASDFEKLFFLDKSFLKAYKEQGSGLLGQTSTDYFYNHIAKPYIEKLSHSIDVVYINLKEVLLWIEGNKRETDVINTYKLLSPQYLLRLPFSNDSNSLNQAFYNELLHILGLEEIKEGSKKFIKRKKEGFRDEGSLIENTLNTLQVDGLYRDLSNLNDFGNSDEEQLESIALELCITWLNRILFMKLLEGQLIRFHRNDKDATNYAFMSFQAGTRFDFDQLNELFFEVLAKPLNERKGNAARSFSQIPYLNSSLFEQTELEKRTNRISGLKDHLNLRLYPATVLKNDKGLRIIGGSQPTLPYLLQFLDAYNFASSGKGIVQTDNRHLINAAVLGLIFEKLNGYRDGSFYTPGFITMYMCRETIRRAVVEKFNAEYGWETKSIDELLIKIERHKITDHDALTLLHKLRICDPAVGSGHFLVSALNELLTIQHELQLLKDTDGKHISGYTLQIENDELVINYKGSLYDYDPKDTESCRMQAALFEAKRAFIENCLFGVDINPKSVAICQLRLWIELLKHAYYKKTVMPEGKKTLLLVTTNEELQTLPNIDINIKTGNSLISRYKLNFKVESIKNLNNRNAYIREYDKYKVNVMWYKAATNKESKDNIRKELARFKAFLDKVYDDDSDIAKEIREKEQLLYQLSSNLDFGDENANTKIDKLADTITKLKTSYEDEKNYLYNRALEWRFDFPEILDPKQNYKFDGFDVVIGNPPYGVKLSNREKAYLKTRFSITTGEVEIYTFFIELAILELVKPGGFFSFITTNTIYYLDKFSDIRKKAFLANSIISLVELEKQVFVDAPDIVPAIYILQNGKQKDNEIKLYKSNETKKIYDLSSFSGFDIGVVKQSKFESTNNALFSMSNNEDKNDLLNRLSLLPPIKEKFNVVYGIKTGDNDRFVSNSITNNANWKKCASSAKNIKRFVINWQGDYLNVCNELAGLGKINYEQPKLLIQYIRKISMPIRLVCALDIQGEYYPLNNFSFILSNKGHSLNVLLAILNSKLMNWYFSSKFIDYNIKPKYIEQLPLPNLLVSPKLEKLVEAIIKIKTSDIEANTTELEDSINDEVYTLYNLSKDEINVIEQI